MKLKPAHNRVIFRFLEADERSAAGLIMLKQDKDRGGSQYGLVLATGPDCQVSKQGDVILLGPGSSYSVINAPSSVSLTESRIVIEASEEVAITDEDMIYAVLDMGKA